MCVPGCILGDGYRGHGPSGPKRGRQPAVTIGINLNGAALYSIPFYISGVNRDDLLRALAVLIALELPGPAREAAQQLPEFIDILDLLRARDGVEQLARALDQKRRDTAA